MTTQRSSARPRHPRDVLDEAIENDSITQLTEALDLAKSNPIRNTPYDKFLASALSSCVQDGRIDLVGHLLEQESASMTFLSPPIVWTKFSIPLLELLIAHGWDINRSAESGARTRRQRIIDLACGDETFVRWLVDHGAQVDGGEDEYEVYPEPAPLLETCAVRGSVSTFLFLQARGARLGKRTLHRAAEEAAAARADPSITYDSASVESDPNGAEAALVKRRQGRSEMLRFLVENLKLDINAMDTEVQRPFHWGTPLCYVATKPNGEAVGKWLLEKGADPSIKNTEGADAEYVAKDHDCDKIVALLKDWKTAHGLDGGK
ncbi:hypothetical protein G7Z17_g9633 [Cylindrodendrum hubeiense]|uniref:Ankyrin n=1 Tax=Cylindrodendrum hubeiense TaxID=595255 RepID=A0A9P5H8T8_9HYPO|nr:hypothetical protein G7Z17_g9633 [Cylindrodendrum hubeiense]